MYKFLLPLILVSFSSFSSETPENIMQHQEYRDSVELVARLGRTEVIRQAVNMQREQLEKYGNDVDSHLSVLRTVGSSYAMTQTVKFQLGKMLEQLNKKLSSKGKSKLTEKDIVKFFAPSGPLYNQQIKITCTNPSTRGLVDSGIEYITTYYDQNMNFIDEITINKSTCI